jgi:uncharacterized protein YutE (UPF0331/DUF86 family)
MTEVIAQKITSLIDLANMLIRKQRFGVPSESKDSFVILGRENAIPDRLGDQLKRMVGFRDLAVISVPQ